MSGLELKVPPVVAALAVAGLMWVATLIVPSFDLAFAVRVVGGVGLGVAGLCAALAGAVPFRRAHTTVDPTRPDSTSSLVVSGVYRFTRNPMYLGMLVVLLGWSLFLANALAFVLTAVFVLYLNRFQITPEERALSKLFGAEYAAYRGGVRRWL